MSPAWFAPGRPVSGLEDKAIDVANPIKEERWISGSFAPPFASMRTFSDASAGPSEAQ
jgi:hypothetical protein